MVALDAALQALSQDLGDPYHATAETLQRALFGNSPSARAQVADGPGGLRGLALFSPLFSTFRGGAGLYVSDLWVDRAERGNGLGPALLQSAAATAAELWAAGFMRLAVYPSNPRARALYDALGFQPISGETGMVLTGQAFQNMRGQS